MATRRVDTTVHMHWTFGKRTAQLRLARVTHAPEQWNGVCRLSQEVTYVRFFADGRVGYTYELGAPFKFDLPSFLREKAIEEIELRFQAALAARALGGGALPFAAKGLNAWVRVGEPCAACPPCVERRIKLFALPEAKRHAMSIG